MLVFLVETRARRSHLSFKANPRPSNHRTQSTRSKKKKTNMGGKDDQEGNNDSGSDDDIAFADDDNDTKDEETNVESYDSDDENLEEVSFMLSIFLYRHLIG